MKHDASGKAEDAGDKDDDDDDVVIVKVEQNSSFVSEDAKPALDDDQVINL